MLSVKYFCSSKSCEVIVQFSNANWHATKLRRILAPLVVGGGMLPDLERWSPSRDTGQCLHVFTRCLPG